MSTEKVRWSKVAKGDRVELQGREYQVVKAKPKGKSIKVTVRGNGIEHTAAMPAKDKVRRVDDKLRDERGAQRRWARDDEAKLKEPRAPKVKAGDPTVTKRPDKTSADPWTTRRDRIEERLEEFLSAQLVGEATDENVGWYVPPVDVSTVAAHLALFHGVTDPSSLDGAEDMLALHDEQHESARMGGGGLARNHWHTKKRPKEH